MEDPRSRQGHSEFLGRKINSLVQLGVLSMQNWQEETYSFEQKPGLVYCPWKPIMGQKILINAKTQMNSRIGRKDNMVNSNIAFVQR